MINTNGLTVYNMDARQLPNYIDSNSVHAIVTDPPYELGLGTAGRVKQWDSTGISFDPHFWQSMLSLVRPGGYAFIFGSPRTWHRLACAVEDAGWLLRDQICWLYASGMPKGEWADHAIDRTLGKTDERISVARSSASMPRAIMHTETYQPQTEQASVWSEWNPSLKPAWEPILVAQKPRETMLGRNILNYETGALHVGAAALPADMSLLQDRYRLNALPSHGNRQGSTFKPSSTPRPIKPRLEGRYPSNVIMSEPVDQLLNVDTPVFYYCAKASGVDRPTVSIPVVSPLTRDAQWMAECERLGVDSQASQYPVGLLNENLLASCTPPIIMTVTHPTVKPLDLIRMLIRLAAPVHGLVLDPFLGSGTTVEACALENMQCISVEKDPLYIPLVQHRLAKPVQPVMF